MDFLSTQQLQNLLDLLQSWLFTDILTTDTVLQGLAMVAAMVAAFVVHRLLQRTAAPLLAGEADRLRLKAPLARIRPVLPHTIAALFLWVTVSILTRQAQPSALVEIAANLLTAWVVIRLVTAFMLKPAFQRLFATLAWIIAALNILGLLDPLIAVLDGIGFSVGDTHVSAWRLLKGFVIAGVLLWGSVVLSNGLGRRISRVEDLTPSVRVLLTQTLRFALVVLAVLVALRAAGVDLTAIALFTGALGIGIGFGLQKIIANLISGIIILLDRSIRPGDVIAVADTYGWVHALNVRYVTVRTRDGIEVLIPNEELITTRVENWSHTDRFIRLRLPFGVDYSNDIEHVIAVAHEAAAKVPRVKADPKPSCLVRKFGDSSVDMELRIWIEDPENGRANVMSAVYIELFKAFKEQGVDIPYPHMDVRLIRSPKGPGSGSSA